MHAVLGKFFAVLCALFWAFAVIFFKRAGESVCPAALNLFKTLVAMALVIPIMIVMGIEFFPASATPDDYAIALLSGFVGITIADSLFFKSLNLLGAGLSAIVECLYSPMLIVCSMIFFRERLTGTEILGAVLVVSAIVIATFHPSRGKPSHILLGTLTGAGSMAMIALSVVLMKPLFDHTHFVWVLEVRLVAAALTLLLLVSANRNRKEMFHSIMTWRTWRLALPGTILGNVLGMLFWIAAFTLTDVSEAAILNQTSTIFIVILASIFLKEPFTVRRGLAVGVGFIGTIMAMAN